MPIRHRPPSSIRTSGCGTRASSPSGSRAYDRARAAGELRALFRGQWANGMLPHMIFAAGRARPRQPHASGSRARTPTRPATSTPSCITQPPLVAIAAWRGGAGAAGRRRGEFLAELFPKLVAYHSWLYRERDLDRTRPGHAHPPVGVRARHDAAVDARAPTDADAGVAARRASGSTSPASCARLRYDTRQLPACRARVRRRRPAHARARRAREALRLRAAPHARRDDGVLVEDLAFNAMPRGGEPLRSRDIAAELGQELPAELVALDGPHARTRSRRCGTTPTGQYFSRHAVTGELLTIPTIATFLPLWAGCPTARARNA